MKTKPQELSELAKRWIDWFQKMGKIEQGSLLVGLLPMDPYENKTLKVGRTVIKYTGVDEDVKRGAPIETLTAIGESGLTCGLLSPDHLMCIIKAGKFDDEPGRWSRWDIETDSDKVRNNPNTRTARAYWQVLAVIVGAVDIQVGKSIDWNKVIKQN